MGLTRYVNSQVFHDPELGVVHIRAISTARHLTARWKPDGLHISIPHISLEDFKRTFEGWKPELLKNKPAKKAARYFVGYKFETDDWLVEIFENPRLHRGSARTSLVEQHPKIVLKIEVSAEFPFESVNGENVIQKLLLNLAAYITNVNIIPQAIAEAHRLGLADKVKDYEVGRGLKRLGFCSSDGRISLSRALAFLPVDLRRSTITHEFAHLTHFDHSPAFKALWDQYLGYSHHQSRARIKTFPWPVNR